MDSKWDPMLLDYQDQQFNRYSQGVGRDLSDGNMKGSKLFVDNFPTDLGQEGFFNLFSECGLVIEAKLKPSNRVDKRYTFGFVTMDSAVSAEYAISKWNQRTFKSGMQPLKVIPAMTEEEKKRRNETKEMEAEFMSSIRGGRGFHQDDDMMSSVSTYARQSVPYYDQRGFGPRKGGGGRGFHPSVKSCEMIERDRLLMTGRGKSQALRDSEQFLRGLSNSYFCGRGGRGRGFHNERSWAEQNVALSFGRGMGQRSVTQHMDIARRPKQENLKICVHCGIEGSAHRCGNCKMYYCSSQCQCKDWPNHREFCLDISIHRFKMNVDEVTNPPQTFASMTQQQDGVRDNVTSIPTGSKFKSSDKNYETDCGKPDKTAAKNFSKHNGRGYESESGYKSHGGVKNFKQGTKNKDLIETKGRQGEKNSESAQRHEKEKGKREPMVFHNSKKRNDDIDQDRETVKKYDKSEGDKINAHAKCNIKKKQGQEVKSQQQKKKPLESDILSVWENEGAKNAPPPSKKETAATSPNKRGNVGSKSANSVDELDASGDASMDLLNQTIAIGISGECYLAHYESPSKLWIIMKEDISDFFQLSDKFKLVLEDMQKGSVKQVKAGELYCMIHEGFWARVKVVTVNGPKISVFFPDVGRQESVNIAELYPLDDTMRILPSQAVCCCLGKVKPISKNKWSEKSKDFVAKWLGEPYVKELSFKVLEKRGNSHALKIVYKGEDLVQTLVSQGLGEFGDTGANLPKLLNSGNDKPKSPKKIERAMAKDLISQMSLLEVNEKVYANITEFDSPSKFMGHIITPETKQVKNAMDKIMKEMNLDCGKHYSPILGELVLAKFSEDKAWYRSEVVGVGEDNFQVLFVDYGNREQLTSKDIRQMEDKSLITYPALAACLGLWGIPTDINVEDVISEIGDLLSDFSIEDGKWWVVIKSKQDSFMLVDFVAWAQEDSLSTILKEKLAKKRVSPMAKIQAAISPKAGGAKASKVTTLPADTLSDDHDTQVVVQFVNSCTSFYVMLKSSAETLQTLMIEIINRVDSLPLIEKPVPGSLVLAQYDADKLWYRAQVKSVKNLEKCTVFFLDYGNSEEVAVEGLRQLPPWTTSQPTMAIHCQLDAESVKLAHDLDETFKYMEGRIITVRVLKKQGVDSKCVVKMMTEDGSDLLEPLAEDMETQESSTIPDAKLDTGVNIRVVCVRVVCRKEFYVQVSSRIPRLNQSTVEREQYVSKNAESLRKVKEGDFAAAQYSKDKEWHRVRVENVKGGQCSVFFIDYGYMESMSISKLRKLSESDYSFPACTVPCALKNCIPGQKLDNYFVTEAENQIDSIRVCGEDNGFELVDIYDHDGVCVTDKFTGQNASQAVDGKKSSSTCISNTPPTEIEQQDQTIPIDSIFETNEPVVAVVVYIQSLCNFYVGGTRIMELNDFMINLQTTAPSEPLLKEWQKGAFCAAQFEEDNMWYRAQISSVHDDGICVVKFIDYGNSQNTKKRELRSLPASAWSLPALAVPCCFKEFESYLGQENNHELSSIFNSEEFARLKHEIGTSPVAITLHGHRAGVAVVTLTDMNDNDVLKKHQIPLLSSPKPKSQSPPTLADIPVKRVIDSNFEVICTNVETLSEFSCQRKATVEDILDISNHLQMDLKEVGPGQCKPIVNGVYGCIFEGTWYRCVVDQVRGDKVMVRYFDWGNTEERLAESLRPLQSKHLLFPISLMKCKLHGIELEGTGEEKSQEYIRVLKQRMESYHLFVDVKGRDGDLYLVSLTVVDDGSTSVDIAEDLVEVGIAKFAHLKSLSPSQMPGQETLEEEDEDDRALKELQRKMEEIQLRKKKK